MTHGRVLLFLLEEDKPFHFVWDAKQCQSVSVWAANVFLISRTSSKQQANDKPVITPPVWVRDVDRKSQLMRNTPGLSACKYYHNAP